MSPIERRNIVATFFVVIIFMLTLILSLPEEKEKLQIIGTPQENGYKFTFKESVNSSKEDMAVSIKVGEDIDPGIYNLKYRTYLTDLSSDERNKIENFYIKDQENIVQLDNILLDEDSDEAGNSIIKNIYLKEGMIIGFGLRDYAKISNEYSNRYYVQLEKVGELNEDYKNSKEIQGGPYKVGEDIAVGSYEEIKVEKTEEDLEDDFFEEDNEEDNDDPTITALLSGDYVYFPQKVRFIDETKEIQNTLTQYDLNNQITTGVYTSGLDIPLGYYNIIQDGIVYSCSQEKEDTYTKSMKYKGKTYYQNSESMQRIVDASSYSDDNICVQSGSIELISLAQEQITKDELITLDSQVTYYTTQEDSISSPKIVIKSLADSLNFKCLSKVKEENIQTIPETIPNKVGEYPVTLTYTLPQGELLQKSTIITIEEIDKIDMDEKVAITKDDETYLKLIHSADFNEYNKIDLTTKENKNILLELFDIKIYDFEEQEYTDMYSSSEVTISPKTISTKELLDFPKITFEFADEYDKNKKPIKKEGTITIQGYKVFTSNDQASLYANSIKNQKLTKEDMIRVLQIKKNEAIEDFNFENLSKDNLIITPKTLSSQDIGANKITITYNFLNGEKYETTATINILRGESPVQINSSLEFSPNLCSANDITDNEIITMANIITDEPDELTFEEDICNGKDYIEVYKDNDDRDENIIAGEIKVNMPQVFFLNNKMEFSISKENTQQEISTQEILNKMDISFRKSYNDLSIKDLTTTPSTIPVDQQSTITVSYEKANKIIESHEIAVTVNRYENTLPIIEYNEQVINNNNLIIFTNLKGIPQTKEELIDYLNLTATDQESGTADITPENIEVNQEKQVIKVAIMDTDGAEGKVEFKYEIQNDSYLIYIFLLTIILAVCGLSIGMFKVLYNKK